MSYLDSRTFAVVVDSTPLISIDLIVRNDAGEVLLGRRVNAPAKGFWFTPGGRIYKNETMADAFRRITYDELGIVTAIEEAAFIGSFEHFYEDSVFGEDISTHYVVLAYEIPLNPLLDDMPTAQHGGYGWFEMSRLMQNETVHTHVKRYFR